MTIGAKFVAIEIVLGAVGLLLAKLLLPSLSDLRLRLTRQAGVQAIIWSIVPIAFAILLASPLADKISFLGTIKALFAKDPMPGFVRQTSLPVLGIFAASAGLTEELLFRGVLQARFGIWIASIVFAAIHAVSFTLFGIALCLGLYFGFVFERAERNLFVPAAGHAACDLAFLLCLRYLWN